jgi:Uma2 family endonuclease
VTGHRGRERWSVSRREPIPIAGFSELQPHLVLFKTEAGARRRHVSPQQIYPVVEVSDTTLKYHSEKKLLANESAAIREYWIINVPNAGVRVFRLNPDSKYEGLSS